MISAKKSTTPSSACTNRATCSRRRCGHTAEGVFHIRPCDALKRRRWGAASPACRQKSPSPPSSSSGCIFLELYLDGVMMLLSPTTTTTTITPPEVGYCASPTTTTTVRAQVPYVRAVEQSMHTADGAQRRTMCAAVRGVRVQSVSERARELVPIVECAHAQTNHGSLPSPATKARERERSGLRGSERLLVLKSGLV